MMGKLYKTYVRPHLEFAIVAWSPHMGNAILKLQKLQHRFNRIIPIVKYLPYEQRMNRLRLTTLSNEERDLTLLKHTKS